MSQYRVRIVEPDRLAPSHAAPRARKPKTSINTLALIGIVLTIACTALSIFDLLELVGG